MLVVGGLRLMCLLLVVMGMLRCKEGVVLFSCLLSLDGLIVSCND
jgi:hypothetical protein